jgi:2-methylcitrate synthase
MPKKSHPMDVARTAVSVMGLEDKETSDSSHDANMRKALRIFAKTPTALAAFYRIRKGQKIIKPKKIYRLLKTFSICVLEKFHKKKLLKHLMYL